MIAKPTTETSRRLRRVLPGLAGKPLFTSRHRAVGRECLAGGASSGPQSRPLDLTDLRGLPVLAFAGLGRNETFRHALTELGADIRGWSSFRDHHRYREADLTRLTAAGQRSGARALVTTDKDRVRISDEWIRELPLMVVGVRIDFKRAAAAFERLIFERLDLDDRRRGDP